MQSRALSLMAVILVCCAAGASNAAPIVGTAGFAATPPSMRLIEHVWCCRYHHHSTYYRGLRWYWSPKPYNCHFDLYYGYLAAHSIREKPCRS